MTDLAPDKLKVFFLHHLNLIYCAKSHLVERLPEVVEQAGFAELRFAIQETMDDIERQIERMEEIFTLLDTSYSMDGCSDMINYVEQAFKPIHLHGADEELRDMAILYYLQNMESLEMSSFQILLLIAAKLKNKQVLQLLKENFDEAKDDRALLLTIVAKYLSI
jgi:ferritin-like metal-binding protein YciE